MVTIQAQEERVVVDVVKDVVEIEPMLQEKTMTENGVVMPDEGFDGLSAVYVDVQFTPKNQTLYVTKNGTYQPEAGYDGFSIVQVEVQGGTDEIVFRVVELDAGTYPLNISEPVFGCSYTVE